MSVISESNKRIAKNTMFLYFRMLLTMGVSLYTVRVVLNTLGDIDYGIFNVVGGIVVMFAFLSNTMSSASQRFFSFELGVKNQERLKKIFSITVTIYIGIAIVIFFLAETFGLWFLNNKMNIPVERMEAARWVYQCSIFSFIVTMFAIPYNASIIAHERMNVYAWLSIVEVLLKLLAVYLLVLFSFDKLKLYSVLILFITVIIALFYISYCARKYEECRFRLFWNARLFKEIVSYSGWNLFGALSSVCKGQGINIVLNMFLGPVVNTARGIAYQVDTLLLNFGNNFFMAVRPQIIKQYAANERAEWEKLVFRSSKFAFFMLWCLSLPLLLETDFVLKLWLKNAPQQYTVIFTKLVIIDTLLELLMNPVVTLVQATGKIKIYQIIVGGVRLLNLPIAYFLLSWGFSPIMVFYAMIINTLICSMLRLFMANWLIKFTISGFVKYVLIRICIVSAISFIASKSIQILWNPDNLIIKSASLIFLSIIVSVICIAGFGLNKNEQKMIYKRLIKFL